MRYYYKVIRVLKKSPKLSADKDVEQWELPNEAGGSVNWKIFII